jgi:polar amino acid transport system substrate-binding protein
MFPARIALLSVLPALLLAGCAAMQPAPEPVRAVLAPVGTLRVGVYPGSPSSLVRDAKTGESAGIALELGQALGRRLGVPVEVVEFARGPLVLDALKAGQVDFTVTNATESRARDMDFTPPLIQVELGYLALSGSSIASAADVDRPGVRVGVSQGSTSQTTLTAQFKSAAVVPAPSLKQAQAMLLQHQIDVFATNKAILFEMADELPGSRVLEGRWGLENLAIAVPKGREAGRGFLQQFADEARSSGLLQSAVKRAGLRGTAPFN